MIKYVVHILILFAPICVSAQCHFNAKRMDLGTTKNFPMRSGSVYFIDPGCTSNGCRMGGGVEIESNIDSIFSSCAGVVSAVFDLGYYECIVVRADTNTFYSITQLSSVIVKKGQSIVKGTFIGKSKQNQEKKLYSIIFMMLDKNTRYFSEQTIWKLLEQANQSECDNEEVFAFQ